MGEEGSNWFKCVYQFHPGYCAESLEEIKPWFNDEILPAASKKLVASEVYKILAVGSGTGIVDKYLLELIAKEKQGKGKVIYTVVEADAEAIEICKKNLSSIKLDIEFRWEVTTINAFLRKDPERYDMIHFLYSLFVLENPLDDITDVLKRNYLVDDGILFTMYHDEKQNFFSDIMSNNMSAIMKIYEGGEDFDGFKMNEELGDDFHTFDPDALEKSIAKFGWNCKVVRKLNKEYLTDIVKKTDEGLEKLGYILGCRDMKQKVSKEELDKIIKQIEESCTTEVVGDSEIKYGESLHCLIIVSK